MLIERKKELLFWGTLDLGLFGLRYLGRKIVNRSG